MDVGEEQPDSRPAKMSTRPQLPPIRMRRHPRRAGSFLNPFLTRGPGPFTDVEKGAIVLQWFCLYFSREVKERLQWQCLVCAERANRETKV